jgi:nitrite reductase (NO-forming)
MRKLTVTVRSLPVFVAVALASLGLVQLASARTDWQARATATIIQVKGGEFFFKLSTKSSAKPGKVTFVFRNVGHVAHDFKINHKVTPLLQPGHMARLVVTFKKGKYTFLCTVPGHAAAGMRGVFRVR